MSAPFGVGDIIPVVTLVWNVYAAYADAPEQFRNFSWEILSLHIVVRKIKDQLGTLGPGGTARVPGSGGASLTTKDNNDLKVMCGDLRTIMGSLDGLLKRYQSLVSNCTHSPVDRLRWGREELAGLGGELRPRIAMLNTFSQGLEQYALPSLTYIDFRHMEILPYKALTNICARVSTGIYLATDVLHNVHSSHSKMLESLSR